MAIHVQISSEVEAELKRQQRNSSIVALLVGVCIIALLATVFYMIGITLFNSPSKPIWTYVEDGDERDHLPVAKVEIQTVKRIPSSSSSSTSAPVIVATKSNVSFSVPVLDVEAISLDATFGASDGFGDAAGSGFGNSFGPTGNSLPFIDPEYRGNKIVFVIDYSLSMKSKNKIGLLKNELKKSIASLADGIEFELIFFAGPAWVGGSTIKDPNSNKKSVISEGGDQFVWRSNTGKSGDWVTVKEKQEAKLEVINERTRKENIEAVMNTPLVWGTDWGSPLEMVFEMRNKPDTVIFLTDGAFTPSGSTMSEFVEKMGQKALQHNITINAISLLEPAARPAMERLSRMTGGEFSLINAQGEKTDKKSVKK